MLNEPEPFIRSIARISNVFEATSNIRPTGFQMVDVTLLTSTAYRAAYPGRGLVEMDNIRSTTFPSVPVTIDEAYFEGLVDLHGMDKNSQIIVDPFYNNSNGTRILNSTLLQQNKINSQPLDLILWDFIGTVKFGHFLTDRTFTVVVFGNTDSMGLNFVQGDVQFTYRVDTAVAPIGLNLLDVSDFYGKCAIAILYHTMHYCFLHTNKQHFLCRRCRR